MVRKKKPAPPPQFTPSAATLGNVPDRLAEVAFGIAELRKVAGAHRADLVESSRKRAKRLEQLQSVDVSTPAGELDAGMLSLPPALRVAFLAHALEVERQQLEPILEIFEAYLIRVCEFAKLPYVEDGNFYWGHAHGFIMRLLQAVSDAFRKYASRQQGGGFDAQAIKTNWPQIAAVLRQIPLKTLADIGLRMMREYSFAVEMDRRDAQSQYKRMRKDDAVKLLRVSSFKVARNDGRAKDDPEGDAYSKWCLVRRDALPPE